MGHGAHKTSVAYIASIVDDFCKAPVSPAAYFLYQNLDASHFTCQDVHGIGSCVLNMNSRISPILGNEAGTGGGVVSGVNLGWCRPIKPLNDTVFANGALVLRNGTIFDMNAMTPNGQANTFGRLYYVSTVAPPAPSKCETPPQGPDRHVNITPNDLIMTLGAIIQLPIAMILKGISLIFPSFGEWLSENLPNTVFGTHNKSGPEGGIFGNNDGKPDDEGKTSPGLIGIAMGLVYLEGFWGDEIEFEKGGNRHDCVTNPSSVGYVSVLETLGQGLGVFFRSIGLGEEFAQLVLAVFGLPADSGFVQGVLNGAHVVLPPL